jgi:hypothetical protein
MDFLSPCEKDHVTIHESRQGESGAAMRRERSDLWRNVDNHGDDGRMNPAKAAFTAGPGDSPQKRAASSRRRSFFDRSGEQRQALLSYSVKATDQERTASAGGCDISGDELLPQGHVYLHRRARHGQRLNF